MSEDTLIILDENLFQYSNSKAIHFQAQNSKSYEVKNFQTDVPTILKKIFFRIDFYEHFLTTMN